MQSSSSRTVIQTEKIGKQVSSSDTSLTILENINLSIQAGESVAIIGTSGSGKSTLLGIMAGLDSPSQGRILLDGADLTRLNEDERAQLRAGRVGFVFQSFHLMPNLTALENVMLPLELAGNSGARSGAIDILQRVGLGERLEHYPHQLSGGEQQRVAIARAFAASPKILFADEPTGNLDQGTGQRIIDLLFQLNKEQEATLVLVTHDQALAERCDRILHLEAGRLKENA